MRMRRDSAHAASSPLKPSTTSDRSARDGKAEKAARKDARRLRKEQKLRRSSGQYRDAQLGVIPDVIHNTTKKDHESVQPPDSGPISSPVIRKPEGRKQERKQKTLQAKPWRGIGNESEDDHRSKVEAKLKEIKSSARTKLTGDEEDQVRAELDDLYDDSMLPSNWRALHALDMQEVERRDQSTKHTKKKKQKSRASSGFQSPMIR